MKIIIASMFFIKNSFIVLHSFTTAVRTGFLYEGQGKIMVGGGDELWLYINGVLVIQLFTSSGVPCRTIDITTAANNGYYLMTH